jgi:hypothetical protein
MLALSRYRSPAMTSWQHRMPCEQQSCWCNMLLIERLSGSTWYHTFPPSAAQVTRKWVQYQPDKSADGDPRRQHRLGRCANQDRSRGRNYTSNRGGHATNDGRMRLDTIRQPRPLVERDAYSQRGHRTSAACVHQISQVFQRWRLQSPEGPLHQGSATPRCPEHQVFPRPASTVSQARWRDSSSSSNNFRGCASDQSLSREDVWTAVATTPSRPPSNPGRTCWCRRGLGRCSKDLNRRSCPDYQPGGVIELHVTMEHSRVSRAALRTGPATVARKYWAVPRARTSLGRHRVIFSWAVPPEDVPKGEQDVLL